MLSMDDFDRRFGVSRLDSDKIVAKFISGDLIAMLLFGG